jgi:pectin methylesterase-like acyl-CoA thioesterase
MKRILRLSTAYFFLSFLGHLALQAQDTLFVPDEFSTIQQALIAAKDNLHILLSQGIYYENLLWPENIDNISLIGQGDKNEVIIDGSGKGGVLEIKNQDSLKKVQLRNLTIQNGTMISDSQLVSGAGILAEGVEL